MSASLTITRTRALRLTRIVMLFLIVALSLALFAQLISAGSAGWRPSWEAPGLPGPSVDYCGGGTILPC